MSWYDARAFAVSLSDQAGVEFRLPTEADWEHAARVGARTAPVASFKPNPNGVCDLYGNLWERVAGRWNTAYTDAPATAATG